MSATIAQALATARKGVALSDPQGVVVYANAALGKQTGFSINEIVGRTPGELWGGQMSRSFYQTLWETIENKQEPFVAIVTNRRKDKTFYPELLAIAPIVERGGSSPTYFLALQMGSPEHVNCERFQETFRSAFSPKSIASEQARLSYLASVLGQHFSSSILGQRSLIESFRTELVEPFVKRFQERTEDRVLVLAAQADMQQFHALYDKYLPTVQMYFLKHLGGNREAAGDLTHDTFYRALQYFKDFRLTNASYRTYLLRVAHNVLVNFFRKQQLLSLSEEPSESLQDKGWFSEDLIWHSPALLLTEQRVLRMKYQEGFSVREIALALNKSENAVKLHLSRARKKLRAVLKDSL